MNKAKVFLFSGQGSQYYQMAKELYVEDAVFRKWMLKLDDVANTVLGESVLDRLYQKPTRHGDVFDHVRYTHPAIFMVEYSLSQTLMENGILPDCVLGTSMGEFASAALAEVMRPEELFEILLKQAECFERYCKIGGMLAIIYDPRLYEDMPLIRANSEMVAVNYDSHFVIAGQKKPLEDIELYLKQNDIVCQSLPVRYGFHSSFIDSAASVFKQYILKKTYQPPRIPFMSGLHGITLKKISPEYFWDVVRMPIQFSQAIQELESRGDKIYIDLGPGGALANFVKRNLAVSSTSESYSVMTPFGKDKKNLERVIERFSHKKSFTAGR